MTKNTLLAVRISKQKFKKIYSVKTLAIKKIVGSSNISNFMKIL